jgi:hypothetical protein
MAALTRADIVTALSAVDGVRVTEFRPPIPSAGQAWPTMRGRAKVQGRLFEQLWGVYFALGIDDRAAAAAWDTMVTPLTDALENIMAVDEVQAVSLAVESAAPLLCAVFVARSE